MDGHTKAVERQTRIDAFNRSWGKGDEVSMSRGRRGCQEGNGREGYAVVVREYER